MTAASACFGHRPHRRGRRGAALGGERWIVVNLQGDEPLMPVALVRQVAELLAAAPRADIATLAAPIGSVAELLDTERRESRERHARPGALLQPRAHSLEPRRGGRAGLRARRTSAGARRHIGIYAYRVARSRVSRLPAGALEMREKLEQLRALENGLSIQVAEALERPGPEVNTPADLERVAALLAHGSR